LDPKKGRFVLDREADAIADARSRLGTSFVRAVRWILECKGRVAVTGLGKAGNIAAKIQATLSSTGTPAYQLHPVEALHGDLGMVGSDDLLLALTKSGTTQELLLLFPRIARFGCRIVLLTARPDSPAAELADCVIEVGSTPEACPLGMAPSSSTAAMLAIGDALALTVMEKKDVSRHQYAAFHPGGSLGRSLMRVSSLMRVGADCPTIAENDTLLDYYHAVQNAPRRAGAASVVDAAGRLVGFVTHGDATRLLADPQHPRERRIAEIMTRSPKTAHVDQYVAEVAEIMEKYKIDELPVVDKNNQLVGLMDIQDLLSNGFPMDGGR